MTETFDIEPALGFMRQFAFSVAHFKIFGSELKNKMQIIKRRTFVRV